MKSPFKDRYEAGLLLAFRLARFAGCPDVMVLALPRGGVPVAHAVAETLRLPLDVLLVRKLGLPENPEVAFGAIAPDGVPALNPEVVAAAGLDSAAMAPIVERERRELERRDRAYRDGRPPPSVKGQSIILVDDGIATGASVRAAVRWLRRQGASRIVVAAPVAAPEACRELEREADEVVTVHTPAHFSSVGREYRDFTQVTDHEVVQLLELARADS